jgi:hypothetical protein
MEYLLPYHDDKNYPLVLCTKKSRIHEKTQNPEINIKIYSRLLFEAIMLFNSRQYVPNTFKASRKLDEITRFNGNTFKF